MQLAARVNGLKVVKAYLITQIGTTRQCSRIKLACPGRPVLQLIFSEHKTVLTNLKERAVFKLCKALLLTMCNHDVLETREAGHMGHQVQRIQCCDQVFEKGFLLMMQI